MPTLSPPILTLEEYLGILVYRDSLTYPQYRILAEWLGVYKFIKPSEQVLRESSFSIRTRQRKPGYTLALYHFQLLLQNHYTDTEQSNIIRHILCYLNLPSLRVSTQESSTSPTPPFLLSTLAQENSNWRN